MDNEIELISDGEGLAVLEGAGRHKNEQFFYRWPESPYLDNASECVSVYTTPQPTQAQAGAVPLTHAQAKALVSRYGNDPLHLVYQVEVAHGIKGGQHAG